MQISYRVIIIFCGLLIFSEGAAQDFFSQIDTSAIRYYTREDGLPPARIFETVQDERGFLWIATSEGLSRFDGKKFKNFFQSNSKNSISSDIISDLEMLGNNKMALATGAGINVFDLISHEVKTFRFRGDDRYYAFHNHFNFVKKDQGNRLWAGSRTGLFLLNEKLEIIKYWMDSVNEEALKTKYVNVSYTATWINGQLVFLYKGEYHFYNENTGELEVYMPLKRHMYPLIEREGFNTSPELWRAAPDVIISKNIITGMADSVKIPMEHNERISLAYFLNDSVILLSTYSNLIRFYSRNNGKLFDIRLAKEYDNIHPQSIVDDVFTDRDNNLWLSTPYFLAKIPLGKTVIRSFKSEYFPGNTFPMLPVYSFVIRDSLWYVGTYGNGLFRINTYNNSSVHFDLGMHDSSGLSNSIWHIRSHSKDTLWISTQTGLLWFHEKNFTSGFVNYPGMPVIVNKYQIICTQFEDSKGIIWMGIGFGNGLVTYNRQSGKWYHYNTKEPGCPLPLRHITAIDEDENGDMWMGTQRGGGLIKWSRKDDKFSLITAQPESEFSQDNIDFIYSDKKGNIWIAVANYGIVKHNISAGSFKSFNRSSGLCSNNATSCILIGDYLWISTIAGISCLNTMNESVINFTSADGLSGNVIERLYFDTLSGNLFCGGAASFDVFNPEKLLGYEKEKPVFITSLSLFNNDHPLNPVKRIELPHNNNVLRFDFSEINFSGNVLSRFEYMLDGLDEKWIKGGADGYASYSGIPPGNYIFKVRKEGSVNEASTDFYHINIHPPFWQTWWFRLLLLLFISGCIYWIVVRRVRLIRKEEKQKTIFNKQLAEVEMKALRAQMNPHFIFNTLNSVNSYILNNDKLKASQYLNRFSKLIRLILESSENQTIALNKEIEMLDAYMQLEQNRFKSKFEYKIISDDKITQHQCEIPSMIIQPYIENAIWHGLMHNDKEGLLKINFSKNENGLVCTIDDNGIGRVHAKKIKEENELPDQGLGIKITRERLQALNNLYNYNSSIEIIDKYSETGNPEGTKVIIHLPLIE
ncbi:MAG TPA: histidine kinase [Bacteroidia bacterium]|nr:histidine kinase [Bacteroidia bacterium]